MDQLVRFAIWFLKYYLPPMVANASPLLVRGRYRVDFSMFFLDGKPLLGKNKTWEGIAIGLYMGIASSLALSIYLRDPLLIPLGAGASASALIGDLLGSFTKRRIGVRSGDPLPLLDQLDFAIASSLYYTLLGIREFTVQYSYVALSLLLILVLHLLSNRIAYLIGVKDKKW
ncbi:MAG: hypothetical protein DRO13_02590 [Thermoprotei archaeon]|nr:MAG: hypothetical protein DRO13_02590 [Thermoprotei archaeon]